MNIKDLLRIAALSFSFTAIPGIVSAAPIVFDSIPDIDKDTVAWREKMRTNGEILQRNHVRQLFLVHGTFVGDDPSGLINLLGNIDRVHKIPGSSEVISRFKQGQKRLITGITQDEGNFTDSYATKLCASLGSNICDAQDNFQWGSGDYHFARLDGTLLLAQRMAERITAKHISPNERILLIGHSHAGQVFALLTTLLEGGEKAKQLKTVIAGSTKFSDSRKQQLDRDLSVIKGVYLDFVTFGTPVRYGWGDYDKFRLLPVINHRNNSTLSGILTVKDGDYVQQWGVEGTDLPSDAVTDNNSLDGILDQGQDAQAMLRILEEKHRRQPKYWSGKPVHENVLVDYRDNYQGILPIPPLHYSLGTVFGHGVYTTRKAMLFNIDLIVKNLYPPQDA